MTTYIDVNWRYQPDLRSTWQRPPSLVAQAKTYGSGETWESLLSVYKREGNSVWLHKRPQELFDAIIAYNPQRLEADAAGYLSLQVVQHARYRTALELLLAHAQQDTASEIETEHMFARTPPLKRLAGACTLDTLGLLLGGETIREQLAAKTRTLSEIQSLAHTTARNVETGASWLRNSGRAEAKPCLEEMDRVCTLYTFLDRTLENRKSALHRQAQLLGRA